MTNENIFQNSGFVLLWYWCDSEHFVGMYGSTYHNEFGSVFKAQSCF